MEGLTLPSDKVKNKTPVAAPRRKRRSPEEIMDRLMRAASEEFRRSGFAGATTANIARNADVTEAQLFRYFGSKAELFREAIFKPLDEHFQKFNAGRVTSARDPTDHRELSRLYITELQEFIGEHAQMLMSLVVAQTYAPGSTQGIAGIDSLRTYFERGAATMTSRIGADPAVDPKLMVRVSFAAVLACILFKDWLFPAGLATEDSISAAIIDFVIDGISANQHGPPRSE